MNRPAGPPTDLEIYRFNATILYWAPPIQNKYVHKTVKANDSLTLHLFYKGFE